MHGTTDAAAQEAPTIAALAAGNEDLATLVSAVEAAGITHVLASEGPFTVFAPVDPAFEALPEGALEGLLEDTDALTGVLTYHVVTGAFTASDLEGAIVEEGGTHPIVTINSGVVTARLEDGTIVLTDAAGREASVVAADVEASNGVVHVIDGVLLP